MMKVAIAKTYVAEDGTAFNTKEECVSHETANVFKPLLNLKQDALDAILARADDKAKMRGDLIEKLAIKVREKRIADGDLKRPSPVKAEPATPETQAAA
jgi:hypothetical protein